MSERRLIAVDKEEAKRLRDLAEWGGVAHTSRALLLRDLANAYEDGLTEEEAAVLSIAADPRPDNKSLTPHGALRVLPVARSKLRAALTESEER